VQPRGVLDAESTMAWFHELMRTLVLWRRSP
jgi:hypothetical protein